MTEQPAATTTHEIGLMIQQTYADLMTYAAIPEAERTQSQKVRYGMRAALLEKQIAGAGLDLALTTTALQQGRVSYKTLTPEGVAAQKQERERAAFDRQLAQVIADTADASAARAAFEGAAQKYGSYTEAMCWYGADLMEAEYMAPQGQAWQQVMAERGGTHEQRVELVKVWIRELQRDVLHHTQYCVGQSTNPMSNIGDRAKAQGKAKLLTRLSDLLAWVS